MKIQFIMSVLVQLQAFIKQTCQSTLRNSVTCDKEKQPLNCIRTANIAVILKHSHSLTKACSDLVISNMILP